MKTPHPTLSPEYRGEGDFRRSVRSTFPKCDGNSFADPKVTGATLARFQRDVQITSPLTRRPDAARIANNVSRKIDERPRFT
jgi:hypothetical protein